MLGDSKRLYKITAETNDWLPPHTRGGLLFRSVATRHPGQIVAIVMILHMMWPEYIYD